MFKYLIILAIAGLVSTTGTISNDAKAMAKEYKREDGHGHFEYAFDITNGIGADEAGDEREVHGEYHFISKEGIPVKVTYTADENGFHPHGDVLPTAPPVPEAIKRALAYIASHPSKADQDDGRVRGRGKH